MYRQWKNLNSEDFEKQSYEFLNVLLLMISAQTKGFIRTQLSRKRDSISH